MNEQNKKALYDAIQSGKKRYQDSLEYARKYSKKYSEEHKDELKEKITCKVCKCEIVKRHMKRHETSKKHQKNIK